MIPIQAELYPNRSTILRMIASPTLVSLPCGFVVKNISRKNARSSRHAFHFASDRRSLHDVRGHFDFQDVAADGIRRLYTLNSLAVANPDVGTTLEVPDNRLRGDGGIA